MPETTGLGTRERLLEAAGEEFGAHGFQKATIRAICQNAGANVASVNYHFGDKASLYSEVLRFSFARTHHRFPLEDGADSTVNERLRHFVEVFLKRLFSVGRSWQGQILAREFADPTRVLGEVVHTFMTPTLERLDAIIAAGCPDLSAEERRLHAFSLVGQCVFFRHARPVLDRLFGPEAYGDAQIPLLTDHIVTVFLRGLRLEGGAE